MGRHKKVKNDASTENNDITSHPFFSRSKSSVRQLTGELYGNISGNNYDESVELAIEWSDRVNKDVKIPYTVVLSDYYRQESPGKKSILFTYNIIMKQPIVEN